MNGYIYEEFEVEALIERKMDRLDELYLSGRLTDSQYETRVRELEKLYETAVDNFAVP
jgi:hypothetical protein